MFNDRIASAVAQINVMRDGGVRAARMMKTDQKAIGPALTHRPRIEHAKPLAASFGLC